MLALRAKTSAPSIKARPAARRTVVVRAEVGESLPQLSQNFDEIANKASSARLFWKLLKDEA